MGGMVCARCGGCQAATGKARAGGLCAPCEAAVRAQATEQQERDYLHAWLYTRQDEAGRLVEQLRAKARAQLLDWRSEPPAPLTFDRRMAALTGRAGRRRGRPRKVAA